MIDNMIDLMNKVYDPDDASGIEDRDDLDHSTPTAPAAQTTPAPAPATSNAPTSSALFAQGTDAWAKARAEEIAQIDINAVITDAVIPKNATETMIADTIAGAFFKTYPATTPELMTQLTAQAYYSLLTDTINLHIGIENGFRRRVTKLKPDPKIYAGMIMMHAMLSTGDIRIIRWEDEAKKSRFAIREWKAADNGRPGHYTGLWKAFEFGADVTAISSVMEVMMPGMSIQQENNAVNTIRKTFYARCQRGTHLTKKWGFRLVFAKNGIVEGYADGREPTFTPWDDRDAIEARYPGLCPLYCLDVDYNPQAVCPQELDPEDYIASLFDFNTVLGQASAQLLWQCCQLAIRYYAGAHGWMVYLINGAGGSKGRNGKSTFLNCLLSLFSDEPESCKWINTQIFAESFEGFDSACLENECIHIADEQNSEIKGIGTMKQYIRYSPVTCRRKNLPAVRVRCYGFKGQASNKQPDFGKQKDKDLATFNRHLIFSFDQDFRENTPGSHCVENIADVLQSKAFQEYFLAKLIEMPFVDDYNPDDVDILSVNNKTMISENMPTQDAIDEILTNIDVSVLPINIIFDLYCGWAKANKMYTTMPKTVFKKDLEVYCLEHGDKWQFDGSTRRRLTAYELDEYRNVKDCDVIIDYAEGCTWSKYKSSCGSGLVPAGGFNTDIMYNRKYTGFVTAV